MISAICLRPSQRLPFARLGDHDSTSPDQRLDPLADRRIQDLEVDREPAALLDRFASDLDQLTDAMLGSVGKCAAELGRYSTDGRSSVGRSHSTRHVARQERDQSPQCVRIAGAGFLFQRSISRQLKI
jgi:hypothetical protein